jgi:hypothetical protein
MKKQSKDILNTIGKVNQFNKIVKFQENNQPIVLQFPNDNISLHIDEAKILFDELELMLELLESKKMLAKY